MSRYSFLAGIVGAVIVSLGLASTALCVEPVIHWTFDGTSTNSGTGGGDV